MKRFLLAAFACLVTLGAHTANACDAYYTGDCPPGATPTPAPTLNLSINAPSPLTWNAGSDLQLRTTLQWSDGSRVAYPVYYTWVVNSVAQPNPNDGTFSITPVGSNLNGGYVRVSIIDSQGNRSQSQAIVLNVVGQYPPNGGGGGGGSSSSQLDPLLTDASVFNATFYMNKYPDVAAAVGYDPQKAKEHWVNNGAAEGRQGIRTFNVKQYIAMYPSEGDYGDWANITREYVANGRDAGLVGLFVLRPEVFSVDNYLYYNADLQGAFGGNRKAVINHWLNNGINEGRQASDTFKVTSYLDKNPDIAARVNYNNTTAIRNYILQGMDAGRDGTP